MKRIRALLIPFLLILCFAGCSIQTEKYEPLEKGLPNQVKANLLTAASTVFQNYEHNITPEVIEEAKYSLNPLMKSSIESWEECVKEAGKFVKNIGEPVLTYRGKTVTVTQLGQFEKREVRYMLTQKLKSDGSGLEITQQKFEPVYTVKENLIRAAGNTVIGMGTVFVILIFLILIISLLGKFAGATPKKKEEKPSPGPAPAAQETKVLPAEVEEEDSAEILAVIAAAIQAYREDMAAEGSLEQIPEDGLVVRSIKRRKANRW